MLYLLGALVTSLLVTGWAYATGDSTMVLAGFVLILACGMLVFYEYERLTRNARR